MAQRQLTHLCHVEPPRCDAHYCFRSP
ncbi:hypothetical protein M3J09_006381 [Ascochyta lentis]